MSETNSTLFTVTSTAASGEGSLAWAISQVNAYTGTDIPTITFDSALAGQEIALSAELSLTKAARLINLTENPVALTSYGLKTSAALHLENMELPKLTLTAATALTGSGNVFTGSGAVIYLSSPSVDMSSFAATATQEGAYIGVSGGYIYGDIHYAVLGEGLSIYRLITDGNVKVRDGAVLTLEEGATLLSDNRDRDIRVYNGGSFVANGARLELLGNGESSNYSGLSQLYIDNGGKATLTNTHILWGMPPSIVSVQTTATSAWPQAARLS